MSAEQFTIPKRPGWGAGITVTIECDPLATIGVKLGLAVRVARDTGANLSGANLAGAYLTRANLTGAIIRGDKIARLVAVAQRLTPGDQYTFYGFELETGGVKIHAGCRWFTIPEFRAHVADQYPDTDKAEETLAIIDFIERRAVSVGAIKPDEPAPKKPRARAAKVVA